MPDQFRFQSPASDLPGYGWPILFAGMGWIARSDHFGPAAPAGGYDILGRMRATPEWIAQEIKAVRGAADRPSGAIQIPAGTDRRDGMAPGLRGRARADRACTAARGMMRAWDPDYRLGSRRSICK